MWHFLPYFNGSGLPSQLCKISTVLNKNTRSRSFQIASKSQKLKWIITIRKCKITSMVGSSRNMKSLKNSK